MQEKQKYIWLLPNAISMINNGELNWLLQRDKCKEFLENDQLLCERYCVSISEDVETFAKDRKAHGKAILETLLAILDSERTVESLEKEGGSGINGRLVLIRECLDEGLYQFIENVLLKNVSLNIDFSYSGLSSKVLEDLAIHIQHFENVPSSYAKVGEKLEDLAPGFDLFSIWVIKCISFTLDETSKIDYEECLEHKKMALINTIILLLAYRAQKVLCPPKIHEQLKLDEQSNSRKRG